MVKECLQPDKRIHDFFEFSTEGTLEIRKHRCQTLSNDHLTIYFCPPKQPFANHHSFEMKKTLNNSSKNYDAILDTADPFG